jgi:hypothetical protein
MTNTKDILPLSGFMNDEEGRSVERRELHLRISALFNSIKRDIHKGDIDSILLLLMFHKFPIYPVGSILCQVEPDMIKEVKAHCESIYNNVSKALDLGYANYCFLINQHNLEK